MSLARTNPEEFDRLNEAYEVFCKQAEKFIEKIKDTQEDIKYQEEANKKLPDR